MNIKEFLIEFEKIESVSGRENKSAEFLSVNFGKFFDSSKIINCNSFLGIKKSKKRTAKKILFDAHIDRIGLCVSEIFENGFIKCTNVGGIDTGIIPSRKFIIHGKEDVLAVSSNKPVHLLSEKDRNSKQKISSVFFDTGIKDVKSIVSVGDTVSFYPEAGSINDDVIHSTGLDNSVSIASLLEAVEKIKNPENELYFLFSSGEETASLGIKDFLSKYDVDYAYVLDAGFSYTEGMDMYSTITSGKGASISFSDTLDVSLARFAINCAKEGNCPVQIIAEPGGTGTNGTHIQIRNGGIPTAVISVPIMNMHTPNETVRISDIEKTAHLVSILVSKTFPGCEVKRIV